MNCHAHQSECKMIDNRFHLDTIRVKLVSESCDDAETKECPSAKAHITINGFQYSLSRQGVNTVLFDYYSGMYENRSAFNVYGFATERKRLVAYVNGLPSGKILFIAVQGIVSFKTATVQLLQGLGVSASFATECTGKRNASMVAAVYTGTKRKDWEQTVNREANTGPSTLEKSIHVFRDLDGRHDCSLEMGFRNGRIPDSAFSVQSVAGATQKPHHARLHAKSRGWCSVPGYPASANLKIDIGLARLVSGIAIQGDGTGSGNYATQFQVRYSISVLRNQSSAKDSLAFDGVRGSESIETRVNWFERVFARYIEIIPTGRVSDGGVTCMRIELFGCTPATQIPMNKKYREYQFHPTIHSEIWLSLYSLADAPKAVITMSTAASNTSLGENIMQSNIYDIQLTATSDYGKGKVAYEKHEDGKEESTNLCSAMSLSAKIVNRKYYHFDMLYDFKVRNS